MFVKKELMSSHKSKKKKIILGVALDLNK